MNSECSICFEIVRSVGTQKPLVTPCGHLFHDSCINSCLHYDQIGKCPQCNRNIKSSELIRLYINEPENSARSKDEVIEQLRNQLQELHEKAQLQYDLIASLNRERDLQKQLSRMEKSVPCTQPKASNSMSTGRIVAPAKLNFQKDVNQKNCAGTIQRKNVNVFTADQAVPQRFEFGSSIWPKPFTAADRNIFKFESDNNNVNKLAGQNENPFLPTTSLAMKKRLFTFGASADVFLKKGPDVRKQESGPSDSSKCSNNTAIKSKSSPPEGQAGFQSINHWPSLFRDRFQPRDNAGQDAIVVNDPCNSAIDDNDVEVIVLSTSEEL